MSQASLYQVICCNLLHNKLTNYHAITVHLNLSRDNLSQKKIVMSLTDHRMNLSTTATLGTDESGHNL